MPSQLHVTLQLLQKILLNTVSEKIKQNKRQLHLKESGLLGERTRPRSGPRMLRLAPERLLCQEESTELSGTKGDSAHGCGSSSKGSR